MKLINLGYNCGSTHIARMFKIYSGCSPFDWCISSPSSICKVLMYMYVYGVEETVNKLMEFTGKNNIIPAFNISAPHFTPNDREKIKRRVERLLDNLNKTEEKILFTFIGPHCPYLENLTAVNIIDDLIKMSKIICLFRPKDSFKIAYIHTDCDQRTEELLANNIEEIQAPVVPEEKFWIYPCVQGLKNTYSLEQVDADIWINPTG